MKKRSVFIPATLTVLFLVSPLCGCSDNEPTSVTDGVEQSEIDAYKANEAAIAAEMEVELEE